MLSEWRIAGWRWGLFALSGAILGLDQVTKYWADTHLILHQPRAVMEFFNLTLVYNTGAAFSFLAQAGGWQRWFLAGLAFVMSCVLTVWLCQLKREEYGQALALSLILGGAVGNLWDRVMLGYVIDFLDFYWRDHHFPAFNVADAAITLGAVLLGIQLLFFDTVKRHDANHQSGAHSE